DFAGFNVGNISALGGTGGAPGGAGTVFVKGAAELQGTLVIDAGSGGSGLTPLGLPGSNTFTVPVPVVIRGSRTLVRPEHPGMDLSFASSLRIESAARMEVEASLSLGGALIVDGASLRATNLQASSVLLTNTALLTTFNPTVGRVHKLELDIT